MDGTVKQLLFIHVLLIHVAYAHEMTLPELVTYANQFPAAPRADVDDWQNPVYQHFYQSLVPNFFSQFLTELGLKKAPALFPYELVSLVQEVTKQQPKPASIGDRFVASLFLPESTIYCWGTLFGAWHSLLRDLQALKQQKVLEDDFSIIDKDCYFIFVGNVIGRSPYSLETLYTVLRLMKKNPGRVFYIRGPQEDKLQWQYNTVGTALKTRLWGSNQDFYNTVIPLFKNFFSKLPLALYVVPDFEPDKAVAFATIKPEEQGIMPDRLGDLFIGHHQMVNYYDLTNNQLTQEPKKINAAVQGERDVPYSGDTPKQALEQLEEGVQSSAWAIISSPNDLYFRKARLFYDAFAKIELKKPFDKSTITLLYHDIRKKDEAFWHLDSYYLKLGLKVQEKEPEQTFAFGSSFPLTRSERILGQNVQRGLIMSLDENTDKLPVLITPYIYDDAYNPGKARANVLEIIKQNISLLLLPIGGSAMPGYEDLVTEKKISVLFPVTGGSQLRTTNNTNVIFLRSSYEAEIKVILEYIMKEYAVRNIAFFYHEDPAGLTALESAHEYLKNHGIEKWTDVSYTSGTTNFQNHADIIKKAQPDAIGFFATDSAISEELMRTLDLDFLVNKTLFGISFLNEPRFNRFLRENGLTMFFANVVPNPALSNLAIVKKYRKAFDAIGYTYDIFSLESYIATSLFVAMIKNIKGPVTTQAIFKALENLRNYEFEGLTLNFDPATRTLLHTLWLEQNMDADWLEKSV